MSDLFDWRRIRPVEIRLTGWRVDIIVRKRCKWLAIGWLCACLSMGFYSIAFCDGYVATTGAWSSNTGAYQSAVRAGYLATLEAGATSFSDSASLQTSGTSSAAGSFTINFVWSGTSPAPAVSYWLVQVTGGLSGVGSATPSLTTGYGNGQAINTPGGPNGAPTFSCPLSFSTLTSMGGASPSFTDAYSASLSGGFGTGGFNHSISVTPFPISIGFPPSTAGGTAGGTTGGGTTGGTTTGGGNPPPPPPTPTPTPTPPGGPPSSAGDTAGSTGGTTTTGGATAGGTTAGGSTAGGGTGGGGVTGSVGGAVQDANGNWCILVGQLCKPALNVPSGYAASNVQWSTTGTTFQSWSPITPAIGSNPENDNASYFVASAFPQTVVPPATTEAGWYYNDPQSTIQDQHYTQETISCTATITNTSTGAVVVQNLPVSIPIRVYTPVWTATGQGGAMLVSIPPYASLLPPQNQNDYFLWAGPSATEGPNGMNWTATVAPPPTSPSSLFGAGSIALAQLISYDRSYTDSSGVVHTAQPKGVYGLDTQYPTPWDATQPTSANYTGGDSPGFDLTSSGAQSATEGNAFSDYLMYTPPAAGTNPVQAVPLANFSWSENGSASIPSGGWANWRSPTAGSVAPSSQTIFTVSNAFPSWTQIFSGGVGAGGFN